MNYKLAFYVLLAIVITRIACKTKVYIGYDVNKYKACTIGMLLQKR